MAGNVFTGQMETQCTAIMLIYMLIFACTFEYVTSKIDEKVRESTHTCSYAPLIDKCAVMLSSANIISRTRKC